MMRKELRSFSGHVPGTTDSQTIILNWDVKHRRISGFDVERNHPETGTITGLENR